VASVKVNDHVEASADAVWDLLGDFGGVTRYSKGIESCSVEGEGVGAVRTLCMPGGIQLQERLEAFDAAARRLQYAIIGDSPLPLSDYLSTIQVSEDGDDCTIDWSSTFELEGVSEEQAQAMVEGIYRGGIAGIKKTLAG